MAENVPTSVSCAAGEQRTRRAARPDAAGRLPHDKRGAPGGALSTTEGTAAGAQAAAHGGAGYDRGHRPVRPDVQMRKGLLPGRAVENQHTGLRGGAVSTDSVELPPGGRRRMAPAAKAGTLHRDGTRQGPAHRCAPCGRQAGAEGTQPVCPRAVLRPRHDLRQRGQPAGQGPGVRLPAAEKGADAALPPLWPGGQCDPVRPQGVLSIGAAPGTAGPPPAVYAGGAHPGTGGRDGADGTGD